MKTNTLLNLKKVDKIALSFARDIEKGVLKTGSILPSINKYSQENSVARDTIEKAYIELKKEGYIVSIPGSGYYVIGKKDSRIKVLLVFNKVSSFNKIVYDVFINILGKKAKVDLHIHHYNPRIFKEIIESNLGNYDYYVIMPHFYQDCKLKDYLPTLERIPKDELILLDKLVPGLNGVKRAIFQDFENDIYQALASRTDLLTRYSQIKILFQKSTHHPKEIINGVIKFCNNTKKTFKIIENIDEETLSDGSLYIAIEEPDLAKLIKKIRNSTLQIGKEVGIISFNESELKELLDISVITTNFEEMGRSAANMILNNLSITIKNPFEIIRRGSI